MIKLTIAAQRALTLMGLTTFYCLWRKKSYVSKNPAIYLQLADDIMGADVGPSAGNA
ncbi:hypothetical protein PEC311524_29440 [Pectobacterium carotovorum subsp. carotovorum]|nr:hypothetical protein PEC311524_29440 [Pectobacterium carotovorum subsp. carotovorum]